jgi:hypothetical protein
MHVFGMYHDLPKAFNCANHNIVLTKFLLFGIQGSTAGWFGPYLRSRKKEFKLHAKSF